LATVAVVAALGLSLTAALLWLVAPRPLSPDTVRTLSATSGVPTLLDEAQASPKAWNSIELRFSGTAGGDATTTAEDAASDLPPDHFVIGNGQGLGDGEVQVTALWDRQLPARGARDDVIRICLVGPGPAATEAQARRIAWLQTALADQIPSLSR
jgi:hypothetical protein